MPTANPTAIHVIIDSNNYIRYSYKYLDIKGERERMCVFVCVIRLLHSHLSKT